MKTRKVWHNCHDKTGNTIFPKGIEWSKPPQVVIGQTMMQFTSVQSGNIYEANVDVKLAADNKSTKAVLTLWLSWLMFLSRAVLTR